MFALTLNVLDKGSRVFLLFEPQFNLLTTAQAIQECAISELALHGELMTKTEVQLCDRNLSSVNGTMSEVQAWIIQASPPEGTDTE